jgi:hypothetical protein
MNATVTPTEATYRKLAREIRALLIQLKPTIADDYRATDDPDDNLPGMTVTVGATVTDDGEIGWSYQTGDNSFTGGAYSHATWGVGYLYRRSNCADLAKQLVDEIADQLNA